MEYFTDDELACKSTGIVKLAPGFMDALNALRGAFGEPMHVNSCCRSAAHNAAIGGNPHSLHVYDNPYWPTGGTCAIDIKAIDPEYRTRLARCALMAGWSVGINIPKGFLHLDRRSDYIKKPQLLFLY